MKVFRNKDKFFGIADSMVISIARLAAGVALARLAGAEGFAQYLLFSMAAVILLNIPVTAVIIPMINLATGMDPPHRRDGVGRGLLEEAGGGDRGHLPALLHRAGALDVARSPNAVSRRG